MTVIDYFLKTEDFAEYLCLKSDEIEELFIEDPARAKLLDAVFEEEFLEQQKDGSEMHQRFTAYIDTHKHFSPDDLYIEVGLYMDEEYRKYLDRKYPEVLDAFISYGIEHDTDMFDATGIYIGSNLFQIPKEIKMNHPSDVLLSEIQRLDTISALLMTNDGSMELDPKGIASLLTGIVDGLKKVHADLRPPSMG